MKKLLIVILILIMSSVSYADLTATEGLAIDLSSAGAGTDFTVAFDPTELLGSRTWGDASTDTIVWTWNRATGTDPTITFNDGSIGLQALTLGTDLAVADGGTGRSTSTTAYGLIAAGTTATGALQTLAAGATTEILVGGGAAALPVWTAATGSGSPVRATSPTLVTPALGTPSALVGTNITGTAAGLTAGTVTTNANLTGDVTSVGNATTIAAASVEFGMVDNTITPAGDPAFAASEAWFGTTGIIFEGSTADGIEGLLTAADPTVADVTWTLRNASGTILLSGDTLTGDVTATFDTDGTTATTIADSVTVTGWVLGTSSATQLTSPTLITDSIDTTGAADMDYGSADVTDHTFVSDGGTAILDGDVILLEKAAAAAPVAAYGEIWVKNATPNQLWFTDDAGTDFQLGLAGATAYNSIGDPTASGSISFDDGETATYTGANDGAISFFTIQNSDADHTVGNMYLLDLDYSADDGDVDADYIKCQDSGSVVLTIQQDGDLTSAGTIEGATITEGGVGVPNLNEIDWVGSAELADEDWGDVAISGGAASVQAQTVSDAGSGTYYVGFFNADTGANLVEYTDAPLAYTQATGTLAATVFSGAGTSLTGVLLTAGTDNVKDTHIDWGSGASQVDLADIPGGAAGANSFDFGGADLELPQASPAVPDADGEVELDFTDGKLVVQHGSAHAVLSSATDVAMASLIKSRQGTFAFPDLLQAEIDNWPFMRVDSTEFPHGIVITSITLTVSGDTSYEINVENWDDNDTINGVNGTIDTVTYTAPSTGEVTETTITYSTIAAGQIIQIDLPTTDVSWIQVKIEFYEPAA